MDLGDREGIGVTGRRGGGACDLDLLFEKRINKQNKHNKELRLSWYHSKTQKLTLVSHH